MKLKRLKYKFGKMKLEKILHSDCKGCSCYNSAIFCVFDGFAIFLGRTNHLGPIFKICKITIHRPERGIEKKSLNLNESKLTDTTKPYRFNYSYLQRQDRLKGPGFQTASQSIRNLFSRLAADKII